MMMVPSNHHIMCVLPPAVGDATVVRYFIQVHPCCFIFPVQFIIGGFGVLRGQLLNLKLEVLRLIRQRRKCEDFESVRGGSVCMCAPVRKSCPPRSNMQNSSREHFLLAVTLGYRIRR